MFIQGNPPYQCKWCKKTFTGDYRRTEHVNRIHYYEQLAEIESQQKEETRIEEEAQKKSEIMVTNTILPSQLTIAAATAGTDTKVQKRNNATKVPSTNNGRIKRKRKNKKVSFFIRIFFKLFQNDRRSPFSFARL